MSMPMACDDGLPRRVLWNRDLDDCYSWLTLELV